ncbi:TonB-dependent receptor [Pseudoxanthomonas helianthi]|uniref:TonB-dependent receptor n=2 Tax=Pseudoxanthomonas helianthi TaxID=1453541 RepID=A0A941ARE3_9GAMM|nr:TonB-dependent receptor [Pseudoxanthomonas helianthi]
MCFAGSIHAQSAVGSLFGKTGAGATVTIENTDTGTSREISAGSDGRFTASQLPPGHYKVTSGGVTREVTVAVGTGTQVAFEATGSGGATTLDAITVSGSRINPIDVSSVESTTVFSQEQIQALPVARDITNVALLAPGTVQGDTGFGNLASFGGSSVAENGYYINGFDVTNIYNFLSFADLPFDAIGSQQIKTGGYGAEYGRSLGGVINLVTKRGTNEWKGGASVYWEPSGLREHGRDVKSRVPGEISVFRSGNESETLEYNVYGGGPIIKDRLFFFGLVQGQDSSTDLYGRNTSERDTDTTPTGLVKLDWNITDNHLLEFTGIRNKTKTREKHYFSNTDYAKTHDELSDDAEYENGGDVYIGKYTGYLTDNFTLSLLAGQLKNVRDWRTTAPEGTDCPAAYDNTDGLNLNYIGCWNPNEFTPADRKFGPNTDKRKAYRADAEWLIGDHTLRFGYDTEKFTSTNAGLEYSGGVYYRYYPGNRVRVRTYQTASGKYEVQNTAYYLEDTWRATDNWLFYLGLRSESFDNKNGLGESFVKADNLIAPRLGFSWDVNGDSTFKVYGNAGRYYIPVASNTNIRGSGFEALTTSFYSYSGGWNADGSPVTLGPLLSGPSVNGSLTPPNPKTVADTELKPMYQDEFILGAQWAMDSWTVGVKGIYRKLKNGMEDYCTHAAFARWAADNGYDDFDPSTMAGCMVINPGKDVHIAMDLNNDGNLTVVKVPNEGYLNLPKERRSYNALEFTVERPKQDKLYLQGSYTFAHSKGNSEGYVNSSLEQTDAGLTQDFDHAMFEDGAFGYLPNDRRHTFKLFGTYDITSELMVSGNLLVQSGRPVSCQGYIPLEALDPDDASELEAYSASSFYCLTKDGIYADGVRELKARGSFGRTPWQYRVDMGLSYVPNWANKHLEFNASVFNVFNSHKVTERNEAGELSRTVDDDGNYFYRVNPDFLNDVNYQAPRYVRFTVRYTW